MKTYITCVGILISIFFTALEATVPSEYNVFCYYDSQSYFRRGRGEVLLEDIEPALSNCTHLIYGYAGICPTHFELIPLNSFVDINERLNYYTKVNDFKKQFPGLKVILSVGGGADQNFPEKYLEILEYSLARQNFIKSVVNTLNKYGFDGIDLAWQFPADKPKHKKGVWGSMWSGVKRFFITEKPVDEKHEMHSNQFKELVRELVSKLSPYDKITIASVLPNVNSLLFFDQCFYMDDLDYVILHAYDFHTPQRYPFKADHANPLKALNDRFPEMNVDYVVSDWLSNCFPSSKIILGIPTYGRVWKTISDCDPLRYPPFESLGTAPAGPLTGKRGMLGYFEICNIIVTNEVTNEKYLKREFNKKEKSGPYAYRNSFKYDNYGVWVSYEDPEDISDKIAYVKEHELKGVAIVDLTLDDYEGVCTGVKFPLLNAVVENLKS